MANLRKCSTNHYVKQSVRSILGGVNSKSHVCNKNFCLRSSIRTFSRTSKPAPQRNFYDDLDIPKTATQSEIKSAYYGLSKVFHPDKNEGSEKASKRFREISAAYEVLGNFRTRRMYDKGIGSFGRTTQSPGTSSETVNEPEEDDAQTKFYKQHMVKSQPPEMADRATARDLDEWSAKRATECFNQQQHLKNVWREQKEDSEQAKFRGKQVTFVSLTLCFVLLAHHIMQERHIRSHNNELQKLSKKKSNG